MTKNYLKFKIFDEFPEIDCRFYGKNEVDKEIKDKIVAMEQVHADNIFYLEDNYSGGVVKNTDGLITKKPNIYLSVRVADCVPIFIYAPDIKTIAVVHSGWKGTLLNVAGCAIDLFKKKGANIKTVRCTLGPSICEKCYKVDGRRLKQFKNRFKNLIYKNNNLDLKYIVRHEMLESGVVNDNIEESGYCTKCDFDKFYSYTNSDGNLRNVGVIGLRI